MRVQDWEPSGETSRTRRELTDMLFIQRRPTTKPAFHNNEGLKILRFKMVWWRSDVESREKERARFDRNERDAGYWQFENGTMDDRKTGTIFGEVEVSRGRSNPGDPRERSKEETAHIKDVAWDDVIPAKAIQNFGGSTMLRKVVMRPTGSILIKETDLDSHFRMW